MAGKVRTWVWVVVAIAVVGILAVVAIAGAGFYFVSRHIDTEAVTAAEAAAAFESGKARFAGQTPLVELDRDGRFVRAHTDRPIPDAKSPSHLHLLAYDPSDEQLIRFRVPFWLLRIQAGRGTITVNRQRLDLEDLKLSVDDLERYGPALLVDHQTPDGERVLVWSQ